MEHKQNILIVHNYYQIPGGEDTVVANEMKMLQDNGHQVTLYSRNNAELKKMNLLKKLFLPLITIFNIKTYVDIKKIIKKNNIEIVHVHNTLALISPSVYYAALSCKVPVVQTMHNFRLLCPGATFYRNGHICEDCLAKGLGCAIKHSCYRNSKIQTLICVISTKFHRLTGIYGKINYICLTEFNKEKLLKLKQVNPNKVFVKPNFTFDYKLNRKAEDYYLFIGRLEKIKGIELVLEAFEKMPSKKIKIVGAGIDYKKYKNSNNCQNIEFLGYKERNELNILLSHAKALIVASQCYETFGMTIIEAYAAHVSVIVGDIGNVGSLVTDRKTGIKYKYDSADDLINGIKVFEELNITKIEKNSYDTYLKEFSEEKNYESLNQIYTNLN